MATFATLQTEVQRRLIDVPSDVLTDVPLFINRAMRDLQADHNFRVMRAEHTANTAAATHVVGALPSNWKAARGRPWYTTQAGQEVYVDLIGSKEELSVLGSLTATTDTGAPQWLYIENTDEAGTQQLQVYPLSNSASDWTSAPVGEYRLVVPYWRFVADLTGSASNWFTVNADEYLMERAVGHGFMANWDESRAAAWYQRAVGSARKAKRIDAENARQGRAVLATRGDVYASPRGQNWMRW